MQPAQLGRRRGCQASEGPAWHAFAYAIVYYATVLCCQGCVVLVALFVEIRWSFNSSLRVDILEVQDGAIMGVTLPLSSGLSSQSFEYINSMNIYHTPCSKHD